MRRLTWRSHKRPYTDLSACEQPVQTGKHVGDSVRAVCGDKPHVQFGRGGLVFLSNQDPAFYLTSALVNK